MLKSLGLQRIFFRNVRLIPKEFGEESKTIQGIPNPKWFSDYKKNHSMGVLRRISCALWKEFRDRSDESAMRIVRKKSGVFRS